jgi:cytidyltransferase-like protein
MSPKSIVVTGAFDDLRSRQIRFLEEASRLGELTVLVWDDGAAGQFDGRPPKFPLAERLYFLNAIRYVSRAVPCGGIADASALPDVAGLKPDIWADPEGPANGSHGAWCRQRGLEYRVIGAKQLEGFPEPPVTPAPTGRKKVVATGCYDWFHTGHVRFCEEVSAHGDLYVIIGHDANIRLLKGEGHPLLSETERRYVVGAIKYVKQALISSGEGWLDADPEIRRLKPDIYAVNEDGDKGGKREYCAKLGIEYLVLKRTPAPGLPRRSSTGLRGF